MKILMLSDPSSTHTVKWVNALADRGLEVNLFGLGKVNKEISPKVIQIPYNIEVTRGNILKKAGYLKSLTFLKSQFNEIDPDLVHAHFATSYGLLGYLLNPVKYVVSVWGSDIFDFPRKSLFHKIFIKKILSSPKLIFSTSNSMRLETSKYTKAPIHVTPFGVNVSIFKPRYYNIKDRSIFNIGIVKSLEKIYGIDLLLESFSKVVKVVDSDVFLTIIGKGSQENELFELARKLGISDKVVFKGFLSQEKVIDFHQEFDLEVYPTIVNESFGVSVVEAMACGTPVIVSDVSGFKEVVNNGECGLIVRRGDVDALAQGILRLINNKEEREIYISNGLKRVQEHYNWDSNVDLMINHYKEVLRT